MERTDGAMRMTASVRKAVVVGSGGTAAALVSPSFVETTGTHTTFPLGPPGELAVDRCGKIGRVAGRQGWA